VQSERGHVAGREGLLAPLAHAPHLAVDIPENREVQRRRLHPVLCLLRKGVPRVRGTKHAQQIVGRRASGFDPRARGAQFRTTGVALGAPRIVRAVVKLEAPNIARGELLHAFETLSHVADQL